MTLTKSFPVRRRSSTLGLRSRPGFSILELTVVLILVGIIMAVAGPRVSAMMTQQRVTRAANMLQTDMEIAFTLAARNRAPTRMSWTSSSSQMLFTVTDRAQTLVYKRTDFADKAFGFRAGEVTASSAGVDVFPNGFASADFDIVITVVRNGTTYSKRIHMTRAGLVKVT